MATTEKKKVPKPQRIKCKGGPYPQMRIEGGMDPLDKVSFSNGHYRLVTSASGHLYEWVGK